MNEEPQHPSNLVFPLITTCEDIGTLLSKSRFAGEDLGSISSDMGSHRDDVSVEGSSSSVADSQWDVVDEESAASGDEVGGISRQPTPFSDPPERLHLDTRSLASNDTSSDGHGLRSVHHLIEFNHSRKDSNSDPPDTARRTVPPQSLHKDQYAFDFCLDGQRHHIQFPETSKKAQASSILEASFHMSEIGGDERNELGKVHGLGSHVHLQGVLRQAMSREILRVDAPFKILYNGPAGVKTPIVEKVGTALAAHLTPSTTDAMESSRVTVVPVSAITENNAPDVVLIDSMGLDMNIEECTFAGNVRGGAAGGTMSLTINNQRLIESSWDPKEQSYKVSGGYQLPHLAIFFISGDESSAIEQTRTRALLFLARHQIPSILIASSIAWHKTGRSVDIDRRTPHLCLESLDIGHDEVKVLGRFPVDLNTFLSIDAGQMNRNIASLTVPEAYETKRRGWLLGATRPGFQQARYSSKKSSVQGQLPGYSKAAISIKKIPIALLCAAWILFIFLMLHLYRGDLLGQRLTLPKPRSEAGSTPGSLTGSSRIRGPSHVPAFDGPRLTTGSSSQPKPSELVALLLETSSSPNKSERFKAQVVGDSHVILRPPTWFSLMKKPPALHFKIQRNQREIPFEFSTLFDGIYALKLPPEDAHGTLEVSLWTLRRPRIEEKFQVEFGTPWMKVRGWWKAARAMADQVKEDFAAAQKNMSKARELASRQLEKAEQAFREVEKVSISSLRMTTKTAKIVLGHSSDLSRALSRRLSQTTALQQGKLHKEISDYSKLMSAALVDQIKQLRGAAAGFDLLALHHRFQFYREQNFRKAQIRMLHAWWKIRGQPRLAERLKRDRARRSGRDARARASNLFRR